MIRELRDRFNADYTPARHQAMVAELERLTGVHVPFPLCETPGFFHASLIQKLVDASHAMVTQLLDNPGYMRAAAAIVPERFRVAGGEVRPTFLQIDFGLVNTGSGIEGRLVELQAFPSLYAFQLAFSDAVVHAHDLTGLSPFIGGLTADAYVALMQRVLVGSHDPAEVVLMEIDPGHQKTLPDFVMTEKLWGVRTVDVREVVKEGRRLFYDRDGKRTRIARIYNRVIPDELDRRKIQLAFDYRDDLDVEWTGAPDWFFRISKFGIPWIDHPWVPQSRYLTHVQELPADRSRWLIKPLFSFAGGGVVFAPTDADLAAIPEPDRHLFLLQEFVEFTPVIRTPYGLTKAEIRIMLVDDGKTYRAVLPLVRMGRGKMMGVDFNKGQIWVGAAAGFVTDRY